MTLLQAPAAPAAQHQAPPAPMPAERSVVLGLTFASFLSALNANVMAALLPPLTAEFGIDKGTKGLLLSSTNVAATLGALALGPVTDRFGRRGVIGMGLVLFLLGTLLHLPAWPLSALFAARALTGLGGGILFMAASAAVADAVPYERRGKAMGTFSAGIFLAFSLGLLLACWMTGVFGWRSVFWLQAALGLLAGPWILRVTPALRARGETSWRQYPDLLRRPHVVAAYVAIGGLAGSFFTFIQFGGDWLKDQGIVTGQGTLGLFFLVVGVGAAVGSVALGGLGDRIGNRRMVLITALSSAALLPAVAASSSFGAVLVLGLLLALAGSGRMGPYQALLTSLVPTTSLASAMALRSAAVYGGMAAVAAVGGQVFQWGGMMALALLCAALTVLCVAITWWFVAEPDGVR